VVDGEEIFVPLAGLIDVDRERARLAAEAQRIAGLLRGIDGKLANERFLAQAPAEVVERERSKGENYRTTIAKLEATLRSLGEE
jgi:valyl-tRNA synthetase